MRPVVNAGGRTYLWIRMLCQTNCASTSVNENLISWKMYLISCCWHWSFTIGIFSLAFLYMCFIAIFYFYCSTQIVGRELKMGCSFYKTSAIIRENSYELIKVWRNFEVFVKLVSSELGCFVLYLQDFCRHICMLAAIVLVFQWQESGFVVRT